MAKLTKKEMNRFTKSQLAQMLKKRGSKITSKMTKTELLGMAMKNMEMRNLPPPAKKKLSPKQLANLKKFQKLPKTRPSDSGAMATNREAENTTDKLALAGKPMQKDYPAEKVIKHRDRYDATLRKAENVRTRDAGKPKLPVELKAHSTESKMQDKQDILALDITNRKTTDLADMYVAQQSYREAYSNIVPHQKEAQQADIRIGDTTNEGANILDNILKNDINPANVFSYGKNNPQSNLASFFQLLGSEYQRLQKQQKLSERESKPARLTPEEYKTKITKEAKDLGIEIPPNIEVSELVRLIEEQKKKITPPSQPPLNA